MDIFDIYHNFFTKQTLDYFRDNVIIYEELSEVIPPIGGSLNSELLIKTYNKMKKSNKSFILIIDKTESNWYHYKIQEKIHELCEQTGVPEDKIVYISNL